MSLNALGVSQLNLKAATSAAPVFSYTSGNYAGVSSSRFDEIIGTATLALGTIAIPLSILDIPSAAVAGACIIEAWMNNSAAGVANFSGAKYVGHITVAGGPPITSATLTINALADAGTLVGGSVATIAFRVLIPRNV
jgi:hypothetical protein